MDDKSEGFVAISTPTTETDFEAVPDGESQNDRPHNDSILAQIKELPTFPLLETRGVVPLCQFCRRSCERRIVRSNSRNHGRPYYICMDCPVYGGVYNNFGNCDRWTTWDDSIGMDPSNPKCYCGFQSRQDRALNRSKRPGMGFWTCASGACQYYSVFRSGLVDLEGEQVKLEYDSEFEPWLL